MNIEIDGVRAPEDEWLRAGLDHDAIRAIGVGFGAGEQLFLTEDEQLVADVAGAGLRVWLLADKGAGLGVDADKGGHGLDHGALFFHDLLAGDGED